MRHKIPAFISRRNAYGKAHERVVAVAPSNLPNPILAPSTVPVQTPATIIIDELPEAAPIQTRSSRRLAAKASSSAGPQKRDRNDDEEESQDVSQPRAKKQKGDTAEPSGSSQERSHNDDEDETENVLGSATKKQEDGLNRERTKAERKERLAVARAAKELAALKARQEVLRKTFDPVAKALQPALKELAGRSQRELKLDTKTATEMMIEEQLDAEMQQKLLRELKVHDLQIEQAKRLVFEEINHLNSMTEVRLNNIRDEYITHMKVEFMRTIREAELGADDKDADLGLGENTRDRIYDEDCIRPPDTEFYNQANKVWDNWVSRLDCQDARIKATRRRRSTLPPLEIPKPLVRKEPFYHEQGLDLLARAAAFADEDTSGLETLAAVALQEDPAKLLSHIPAKCRMPPPPAPQQRDQ